MSYENYLDLSFSDDFIIFFYEIFDFNLFRRLVFKDMGKINLIYVK